MEKQKLRSSSSSQPVSLLAKVREWFGMFQLLRASAKSLRPENFTPLIDEVAAWVETWRRHQISNEKKEVNVLEIGFGAKPRRALALQALGHKVTAVDLDWPVRTYRDLPNVLRTNGVERFVKSLFRHVCFDRDENEVFLKRLRQIDPSYQVDYGALYVGDASSEEFWQDRPGPYDMIVSTDVFEHIPLEDLDKLTWYMKQNLAPTGIAIITPNVFTGICGGHDLEWRPDRANLEFSWNYAPWGHLRGLGAEVNTYLNKAMRKDYVSIFSRYFKVVEDTAVRGRLGERWLSDDLRLDLEQYDDYELFSNNVKFVLVPRQDD
jgi:hypothetical protein